MPMDNRDPCDAFLEGAGSRPVNPELRQALRDRTTGVLRWRRRIRRLALIAGLAAFYVAGIATMRLAEPAPPPVGAPEVAKHPPAPPKPGATPTPAPVPMARAPEIDPQLPPNILEQLGELASKEQRTAYFRLAGDRYEKAGDVRAALRCYRLALNYASEVELAVSPSDSYLLMVLKNARQKEKRDGNNDA
jgi:hypothetical protein